jgi:hypothetical protein
MKKILEIYSESPKSYLLFFILISYLFFAHTLQYDFFIYDDIENIVRNPNVISPTLENFFGYWLKSYSPLPFNVWQLISSIFGIDSAAPYRLINIIIHGLNLFIGFNIAKSLFALYKIEDKRNLALQSCLLFAVHPLIIESVVWPSSLRTLLGAFFALSYLKHSINQQGDIDIFSYLLIFCSILSNPIFSAVAIIPLVAFFEIPKQEKGTHATAIISLIGLYFYFHKHNIASTNLTLSIIDQVKINIYSLYKYIQITNFPIINSISYQLNPNMILSQDTNRIFLALGFVLLYFGIPHLILRKSDLSKLVVFFQAIFFLSIISNCGLLLHDFSYLSIVSNRYSYLAIFSNGIILLIVADHLIKKLFNIFYGSILITFIILFFKASFHWNNQIDLITNSIAFYGKNAELYTVAGVRAKKLNRTPDAQYFFNQAIAVNKNDSSSYMHLIHLLSEEGNREEISSFLISNQSQFTILESNILLEVSALYLNILDYGNAEKYLQLYLNLNPANDRTLSIESEIKNLKEYIKKINL